MIVLKNDLNPRDYDQNTDRCLKPVMSKVTIFGTEVILNMLYCVAKKNWKVKKANIKIIHACTSIFDAREEHTM